MRNKLKIIMVGMVFLSAFQHSNAQVAGTPYFPYVIDEIPFNFLFGGAGEEEPTVVQTTADGGYILGGHSSSSATGDVTGTNHGSYDYWIIKVDKYGKKEWQKLYGGNSSDFLYSLQQTADGGYIMSGSSSSSANGDVTGINHSTSPDSWIVKTDAAGTIQWQRLYGGTGNENGKSIKQTADGGYIMACQSVANNPATGDVVGTYKGSTDFWIVKLNALGVIQWQKLLGGNTVDQAIEIQQTTDGGYIVGGDSNSSATGDVTATNHGGYDCLVFKLDASGNIQWHRLLGGSGIEKLKSIQQTADGGYILSADSASSATGDVTGTNHGGTDSWVVKLTSTGTTQWQKLLGGNGGEIPQGVRQTADGGYILGSYSDSSANGDVTGTMHGIVDSWIVKLDASGNIQWNKLYGGSGFDFSALVKPTPDGGYIVVSYTTSSVDGDVIRTNHGPADFWLYKLNSLGNIELVENVGQ